MAIIHNRPVNYVLRTIISPFKSLIPPKAHFAIDGEISIDLTEGKKMKFCGNPTSNLLRVLFWKGYKGFEPKEYDVFVHVARQSDCLLDVGANIGYYSILGKLFKKNLKVYAFEAMPDAKTYLDKNIALNNFKDINTQLLALSNQNGSASFFSSRNPRFPNIKEHLFGDNSLDPSFPHKAYEQIEIKVITQKLDSFVQEHNLGPVIDFMKLDTEGSENLVLEGAEETLAKFQPIVMCEIVKDCIEKEIEAIFKRHNYKFFRLVNGKLVETTNLIVDGGKEDYFMTTEKYLSRLQKFIA